MRRKSGFLRHLQQESVQKYGPFFRLRLDLIFFVFLMTGTWTCDSRDNDSTQTRLCDLSLESDLNTEELKGTWTLKLVTTTLESEYIFVSLCVL